jgi:hypothetical protein
VPPAGFGGQLDMMRAWLDVQVGSGAYWLGGDAGPGRPDAMAVYFLDVRAAAAFVDRFACGMAVLPNPGPEDRPR